MGVVMRAITLLVLIFVLATVNAFSATDGFYQMSEVSSAWEGTPADRLVSETASYQFNYGDEDQIVFDLPWAFSFYGEPYTRITVDTNGNIWFGTNPVSTTPVVSAWNADLSSYALGGVFVQHKTSPERVVVEWQTETLLDQGYYRPNVFEVVLYSDGLIQLNFKTFDVIQGEDSGSGLFSGDGMTFINLSATYGDVHTLAGRSFLVEPIPQTTSSSLHIFFAGNGSGTVVSTPAGVDCGVDCSTQFPTGTEITLSASALTDSSFTGWSNGPCSGTGDCVLTLDADTAITANFTIINIPFDVLLESTQGGYTSVQSAYDGILGTIETIKVKAGDQTPGDLIFDRNVTLRLEGGYDAIFENMVSDSSFYGTLKISDGQVTIMNVRIK